MPCTTISPAYTSATPRKGRGGEGRGLLNSTYKPDACDPVRNVLFLFPAMLLRGFEDRRNTCDVKSNFGRSFALRARKRDGWLQLQIEQQDSGNDGAVSRGPGELCSQ